MPNKLKWYIYELMSSIIMLQYFRQHEICPYIPPQTKNIHETSVHFITKSDKTDEYTAFSV